MCGKIGAIAPIKMKKKTTPAETQAVLSDFRWLHAIADGERPSTRVELSKSNTDIVTPPQIP